MPAAETLATYRCGKCGRALLEYDQTALQLGEVVIVKVCERCKKENVLEIRPT
jgi:DNA-directed RNA polymerase subunit RPC12/RpoP